MIKMETLKPIIEPLLNGREDAANIIEALAAIDTEPETVGEDAIATAVAENDAKWAARYFDTFFGKDKVEDVEPETVEETEDEPETYENLFE